MNIRADPQAFVQTIFRAIPQEMATIDMRERTKSLISLDILNPMPSWEAGDHLLLKYAISQRIGYQRVAMGWLRTRFAE